MAKKKGAKRKKTAQQAFTKLYNRYGKDCFDSIEDLEWKPQEGYIEVDCPNGPAYIKGTDPQIAKDLDYLYDVLFNI